MLTFIFARESAHPGMYAGTIAHYDDGSRTFTNPSNRSVSYRRGATTDFGENMFMATHTELKYINGCTGEATECIVQSDKTMGLGVYTGDPLARPTEMTHVSRSTAFVPLRTQFQAMHFDDPHVQDHRIKLSLIHI